MQRVRYPAIVGVIVLCGAVFLLQQTRDDMLIQDYAAIPRPIVAAAQSLFGGGEGAGNWGELTRLLTAVFLHGSGEHILYNMIFFWAFGILAAQTLGQWPAVAIFLITGIAGNVAQVTLNRDSMIPILGASGGIMGLEGLYLGLALRWHLPDPDVWPLAHPIPPQQLALFALVGFGFDAYSLMNKQLGIAYGAHIGGFVAGLALALVISQVYPTTTAYRRAWGRG